ncbi:MAG: tetratricopeptide repeat protein, partial [Opitutaceae bacterium]
MLPPLPAELVYADRPEPFNQALRAAFLRARIRSQQLDAVRHLARLYQANRLPQEARACYARIAALPGGLDARDQYYLARSAFDEGNLAAAQLELRAVLSIEPRYLPARLALAEAFFKRGENDDATREYLAALGVEPNQPQALVALARIDLQKGDEPSAISRLEKVLATHPEATSAAGLLAQLMARRNEPERAAALTQWSQQRHEPAPVDPWMNALLADCYDAQRLSLLFEEYLDARQMDDAMPLLARLEQLDAKSWTPHLLRGWSLARAHRDRDAVSEYREALARGGDAEKICPLLVASLQTLGEESAAATVVTEYAAKLPDSIPLLTLRADFAMKTGDDATARDVLRRLLKKEPFLHDQNMSLAKLLWDTSERAEAVACLQRVTKAFPADVPARGLLGQYYLEAADPWSAISLLEQALPHAPPESPVGQPLRNLLGLACLQAAEKETSRDQLAEAANHYERAIQLDPENLDAS